ncbi:PaaI family thioesterase [uncultured Paludibaculum sp.]|uniref:PaaI family thioesterase n=1 Tax=uncultured Paludibaculum sp. TaxID=1765020 RepID=UPI002AAA82C2|nr:PaaI family thioesterase [uncultured Paludibaculum sp.]
MAATSVASTGAPWVGSNELCFACGGRHPHGLHLRFEPDGAQRVRAEWQTDAAWQGFQDVIHGGIVSTVLDEAMSKSVAGAGIRALTCELRVRLRHSVAPHEQLTVRGWVVQKRKRLVSAEASLTDGQGVERAHAWATFLELQRDV